jgi:hypothetical protein
MTKDIDALFRSRATVHGNTLLLAPSVALEYLKACHENGVQVLGFDAFRLLPGGRIQPIMDDSLDLSAQPFSRCSLGEGLAIAERFIKERMERDILFEMVTG